MSSPGHSSLPADARRPEGATDDATRYRAFLEQDAVGAEIGLAGRFLTANARFCGIAGHPWEELRELHFQDITGPEDRRARAARRCDLASEHEPYWYEIYGPEKVFGMCYQVDHTREGRDIGLAVVRKAAGRRRRHEFRAGRGQHVLGGIAVGDRTLSHG